MATYATYRHIELDKVGYSKKRVRNPSSEIFNVLSSPPAHSPKFSSHTLGSPRKSSSQDSFNRLFGETKIKLTPRRASLSKHDVSSRNPVTGNGVMSWDVKLTRTSTPRVHKDRNPVTGEVYTIISPVTTPTKVVQNGFAQQNGHAHQNGTAASPEPISNGSS